VKWLEISLPGCRGVLVARFDLDSPEENPRPDEGVLSAEEIRRARRFVREEDARRFVAGRAWIRRALGELLGAAPGRIVLAARPFGKPEIREPASSLSFSLAHAGAQALLAVAQGGRVGVDIEARDAAPDAETLAPRALAPRELEEFHARPLEEREPFFLARWTAKEALLKAAGIGLSSDPARITLEPEADGSFLGRGESRIAGLRAWPLEAGPRFVAALAAEVTVS
jgi:4'-phosphopantetheinyl transferase